jgi:hypothetical protein
MKRLLALAVLATAHVGSAHPQGIVNTPEGERACAAEAKEFCSQGGGAVIDCLLDHQNDLSDECYSALKVRLQNERGMQACKQDSRRFCPEVEQGGGRVADCLIDHEQEISEDCYQFLKSRRGSANP